MADSEAQDPPVRGELILIFDVHINKKYGLVKPEVRQLVLQRNSTARLSDLTGHLETNLQLQYGDGRKLLLHAICNKTEMRMAGRLREIKGIVPLVCDQVWSLILTSYRHSRLKILVEQNRPLVLIQKSSLSSCVKGFLKRELLFLNASAYFPTKSLVSEHIMDLCRNIFERGMKIKPELRKGAWLHLVGVFPPDMKRREERELYFNKLKRVYDSLRGKWMGLGDSDEVRQLLDAVQRDAVRTDPGHPFYEDSSAHNNSTVNLCDSPQDDNIQKLVNIITIYTLEHGTCTYTQGMTDMLSPILYVMKHEADAYVCFAAMVERIRHHFETWCVGTLLKLERLKHLCEVLDPELFHHLIENIEEDAFALFFGMVLIECRREFSFEDSFHLLEAIWAAVACMKDSLPRSTTLTHTEWAHYMTQRSPDVLQQVMGETGSPYSAVPLPISESFDAQTRSRQASFLSQGSTLPHDQYRSSVGGANLSISRMISQTEVIAEEGERLSGETSSPPELSVSEVPVETRPRAFTDPSLKSSNLSLEQTEHVVKCKLGLSDSHSESEIRDGNSSVPPHLKLKSSSSSCPVTEMSDMSSLSSNINLAHNSDKSVDSKTASGNGMGSDRSHSPAGKLVNGHCSPSPVEESDDGGVSLNFEINNEGVMLGLNLQKDEKGVSAASSDVSTLNKSVLKESPTAAVGNGILPQCSASSALPSNHQSALNMLPNGNQSEGVSPSPSHPSGSEIYQTANDDSSVTDLQSQTISLTPSPPPTRDQATALVASINSDINDPRLEEEGEATPVHRARVRPPLANGAIIQGKGMDADEHNGSGANLSPTGNTTSVSAVPVIEDVCKISDGEGSTEQQRTKPAKVKGSSRHRAKSQPQQSSPLDMYDGDTCSGSSRVTPVTFFDAMEQLASSAPGSGPNFMHSGQWQRSLVYSGEQGEENELELSQANSMIFSQLMSTDRSAPLVSREKSLDMPVSDCFPLFVCLSILVQHRDEIMRRNIDFVGLSVLLNAQAGTQDIDVTLDVARHLYKTYREYQMTFLNNSPEDLDTWLDDDRAVSTEGQQDPADNDHEERTSIVSDSVFTH